MLFLYRQNLGMKQFILIVLILTSATVFAQTSDENANYGTITINQDPRIAELVNTHIEINKANNGKIPGWRVQIYNSSGTNSRTEVQNARKLFLSKYITTIGIIIIKIIEHINPIIN